MGISTVLSGDEVYHHFYISQNIARTVIISTATYAAQNSRRITVRIIWKNLTLIIVTLVIVDANAKVVSKSKSESEGRT